MPTAECSLMCETVQCRLIDRWSACVCVQCRSVASAATRHFYYRPSDRSASTAFDGGINQ